MFYLFFLFPVMKTNNHLSTAQKLLKELMITLDRGYYDHVGGSLLWHKHQHMAKCLQNKLNNLQLKEVSFRYCIYV